jgi:hypothetical protein
MKKIILLFSTLIIIQISHAQWSPEVGLSLGTTHFYGDLGNERYFPLKSTRWGGSVTFRNFLNNPAWTGVINRTFDMEARISYHRIGYDETAPIANYKGFELRNYGRGLSFRNDIIGFSTHATLTHYRNRFIPLYKQTMAFYLYAGVGIYYSNPKADLFRGDIDINNRYFFWSDGSVRDQHENTGKGNIIEKDGIFETNLRDWFTEGQGAGDDLKPAGTYSLWNVSLPFGAGIRYGINKRLTFSAEVSIYNFTTDFLDDVSDRYATYQEIRNTFPNDPVKQELAIYISDPTGKGTNGVPGPATSPRGNPKKNDMFSYIGLELSYKFIGRMPNIYLK